MYPSGFAIISILKKTGPTSPFHGKSAIILGGSPSVTTFLVSSPPSFFSHPLPTDVQFVQGDGENLPFPDATFDVATISFGIRNFTNIPKGLRSESSGSIHSANSSVMNTWRIHPKHYSLDRRAPFLYLEPFLRRSSFVSSAQDETPCTCLPSPHPPLTHTCTTALPASILSHMLTFLHPRISYFFVFAVLLFSFLCLFALFSQ